MRTNEDHRMSEEEFKTYQASKTFDPDEVRHQSRGDADGE